eukprot:CAMPEP_0198301262 /NCGR_PEP_ID=MMETSP1449-20131203/50877_1 /TAXON_ID=420275 /ORGANISM="Attheya septentrionalis, Strain CCMP2084" /LENGTH=465 /DNA_ID=CAMNT_0044003293 /DNA_START=214 /DNA_END=1611 /DNA_ORIENTATION=-
MGYPSNVLGLLVILVHNGQGWWTVIQPVSGFSAYLNLAQHRTVFAKPRGSQQTRRRTIVFNENDNLDGDAKNSTTSRTSGAAIEVDTVQENASWFDLETMMEEDVAVKEISEDECEDIHGDICLLADFEDDSFLNMEFVSGGSSASVAVDRPIEELVIVGIQQVIRFVPFVSPVLAFFTYEPIAAMFATFLNFIDRNKNWVAVDGGAYQGQIITPAINGIIMPAIAILFATLISETISTLRQRQLDIRTTINTEAAELRALQSLVDCFPEHGPKQDQCRSYLIQYITRLIAESQPGVKISSLEFRGSMDSEMNGFMTQLNQICLASQECEASLAFIPPLILSESYGAVTRLNAERAARISALQSTFPTLHYTILTALAGSICTAFLIESNQELLIFLNAIQLRILWTMLIGTFSSLSTVCYDLGDPFHGSYQISRSVDQLFTIRETLQAADASKKIAIRQKCCIK